MMTAEQPVKTKMYTEALGALGYTEALGALGYTEALEEISSF